MVWSEANRITNKAMLVFLDFHDLLCLCLWRTVVVNDADASTKLQETKQLSSLFYTVQKY